MNRTSIVWAFLLATGFIWCVAAPAAEPAKAPLGDGPFLLVANKHSDTLCFIDTKTYKILDTISTGPNPHEIVITPDGKYAYLSNYAPPGNTISLIDLPARKHIKQIPTGKATRVHGAAMAPDGKFAYFTAGQTGYVIEVDTAKHEVTRIIPTEGKISHMVLVSPDGKRLYTANIVSEDVSVIDRASGRLIKKIPCGKGVEGMAFTPDGKHLWAGNQTAGSITIIDVATNEPIKTFPCAAMPVRIRFFRRRPVGVCSLLGKEGNRQRDRHENSQGNQTDPGGEPRYRHRVLAGSKEGVRRVRKGRRPTRD